MALDVHYSIKPGYYLSRFAFCWPFQYTNGQIVPISTAEKLLGGMIGILHILILGWSLYQRNISPRVNIQLSQSLLDDISTISATVLTLVAMGCNNIKKNAALSTKFFKQLMVIDRVLQCPEDFYRKNRIYFRNKALIQIVLVVVLTIADNCMWISNMGLLISTYYFHLYVMYLLNNIVTQRIDFKIILLKERLALLNERLSELIAEATTVTNKRNSGTVTPIKPTEETIRNFNKVYDVLCDLIESINTCHGVEIIILSLTILTVALNTLVIGFTLFRSVTQVENILSTSMQFLWSAYYIILGMMLASSSSATVKLSSKTSILSHKLLLEYSSCFEESEKLYYSREELKLLIDQVAYRSPTFSAAGFFTVDYTMLYAIVGAVTSYFIVLLQLP